MNANSAGLSGHPATEIHAELENTRTAFHNLLHQISDLDLYLPSGNSYWTIGEVLNHIAFGLKFIPVEVPLLQKGLWYPLPPADFFNWINPTLTRFSYRDYNRQALLNQYDQGHAQALKTLESVQPGQWSLGRSYPNLDPPTLSGFVTIEDLFRSHKAHFEQHAQDIRQGLESAQEVIEGAQARRQKGRQEPYSGQQQGVMSYPTHRWHKALFKAPLILWRLGLGRLMGGYLMLLTHTGRKTGLPRRTMVEYHKVGGRKYAPVAFGPESDWFKNISIQPQVTVQTSNGAEGARAVRVEDDRELLAVYYRFKRRDPPLTKWFLNSIDIQDDPIDLLTKKDRVYWLRFDPIREETPSPLSSDLVWIWPLLGISLLGYWVYKFINRKPD